MKYDMENNIKELHKREVKEFLEEQAVKEEDYFQQAEAEGYEDLHEYEQSSLGGIGIALVCFIIAIIVLFVRLIVIG